MSRPLAVADPKAPEKHQSLLTRNGDPDSLFDFVSADNAACLLKREAKCVHVFEAHTNIKLTQVSVIL